MDAQTPDNIELAFFTALIEADVKTLSEVLSDDFILIDLMSGSEIPKTALLEVVGSGQLTFERIDRVELRVRRYGAIAVLTGRTEMLGRFVGEPFQASSRYTHVFMQDGPRWTMIAAQGTQITDPQGSDIMTG